MTVAVSTGNAVTTASIVVRCPYCGAHIVTLTGALVEALTVTRDACPRGNCRARVSVIVPVP